MGSMARKRTVGGERRVTRAGRKLARIMKRLHFGETEMARKLGVERVMLHRVLIGERWKYITVDFALKCVDGTDGEIQIEDFASLTADGDEEPLRATGS